MSETNNEKELLENGDVPTPLPSETQLTQAEEATLEERKKLIEEKEKEILKRENNIDLRTKHHNELQEQYKREGSFIDRMILLSLYILLIITTFYALINIGIKVIKDTKHSVQVLFLESFESQKKNENSQSQIVQPTNDKIDIDNENLSNPANREKSNKTETLTLETAEYIFLYLLPLFIILGFFHYYTKNARYSLLQGSTETIDYEDSTRSVNLTKFLFISSIISYVIIKVIEEILIKGVTSPTKLISFGVLLLLLMSYYIYLDRKKH